MTIKTPVKEEAHHHDEEEQPPPVPGAAVYDNPVGGHIKEETNGSTRLTGWRKCLFGFAGVLCVLLFWILAPFAFGFLVVFIVLRDWSTVMEEDNRIYFAVLVVIFSMYIFAMCKLRQDNLGSFCLAIHWLLFVDFDVFLPILLNFLFLPMALYGVGHFPVFSTVISLVSVMLGLLFLVLLNRGLILTAHDYSISDTMGGSENGYKKLVDVIRRGIQENNFQYKYVPKTHIFLFSCMSILMGVMVSGMVDTRWLAFTLPFSFLCLCDICRVACRRGEDDDFNEPGPEADPEGDPNSTDLSQEEHHII
jgi:hypothetical protein